ncbi:MAG TPA: GNAT family protein [Nocardioides sp.]|uniref:GNAT family N-acetyltransferase n=1 Tax=Nocardioides sp. TaxID=35761 RepID=UPI002E3805DA|nr:GNAT family protein [Nocardioides sp.]HEX5087030.1 GNAT family protein [Nocardioides sp.]
MSRSIADLDWPVTTERLTIRPAEQRDAAATYAFRSLPEVAEWITSQTTDLAAWEAGFGDRLADTLIIELDGVVVGDLMLRVQDAWAQTEVKEQAVGTEAEIGYTLDPAYGGRGVATEAVRALLEIAFVEIGVRRVIAQLFADNLPSRRLLERLGMRREQHTKQDSLHRNGEWMDGMMYAMLKDEWLSPS